MDPESPVDDLIAALRASPRDDGGFGATAPDWFGERVFGGVGVAQALHAAALTVDDGLRPHSVHAAFLAGLRPGPVDLKVEALRDGRTFSTRQVVSSQGDRRALLATVSFRADEEGDDYELPPGAAPPAPDAPPRSEDVPPPFEVREIGPTEVRADGTYASTRRYWVRTITPVPGGALAHAGVATFLSDMTGTCFRPLTSGVWGTHSDASIDHAVWFHRPFVTDDWVYADFHALVNATGCATVRGEFRDRNGRLCMSMAQELLIRPLA